MGEYIKNPKTQEEIKIGVLDHCFFSRAELLEFKRQGFKGFYAGEYDIIAYRKDSLDLMLENPNSLFQLAKECTFNQEIHTITMKNDGMEHHKVILQKCGNRGSAYTYVGLECKQKNEPQIYAVMIGERYDESGKPRTIFQCDCCEAYFSITKEEAKKLKQKHPYWAKWINPHPKAGY